MRQTDLAREPESRVISHVSFSRRASIRAYLPTPLRSPARTWYLIVVHNNNVAMRVVVRVMMPVMMFVDDHVWFVSDNDFIGTHHGCER